MTVFKAGFSRVDITPPLGVSIAGYFHDRFASGVLDNLEVNTLVVEYGSDKAALIALDNLMIIQKQMDEYRNKISAETGLPYESIFISCSHTHNAPLIGQDQLVETRFGDALYTDLLGRKLSDSVKMALADCQPAKMGYATGIAPNISFIRRFRMKDGSIRTNPGVDNPDIDSPIGRVDERVNVLRFVREKGPEIILANFGVHPDTIGGDLISADYPGFVRRETEKIFPNARCLFFNGVEGDVNHVNVHPTGGFKNGLQPMFDDVDRGYEHSAYMGRVITGAILQVYDKVKFTKPDCVKAVQITINAPSNMTEDPDELSLAKKYVDLHLAGKDDEIPYKGMELTTVVAESLRMTQLKDGPREFSLYLSGIRIGEIAFLGIPGEPFTEVGFAIKEKSPFDLTFPCALTNGAEGYYPTMQAYIEGGYEARSSYFKSGIAELIIDKSLNLLESLYD